MVEYSIEKIYPSDSNNMAKVDALLQRESIRRDTNLDYTCALYDGHHQLVGTGSCYKNTLRCLAIDRHFQGEGLLNQIISHLVEVEQERGLLHLFVYTKATAAEFFKNLGFREITRVDNQLVFLENRPNGFQRYLKQLQSESDLVSSQTSKITSIVMNANPFSLGHQYLVEKAAQENDVVHLFMVSDAQSLIPYGVRKQLIVEGTKQFPNVIYHDTGSYMISSATFPSYFLKDSETVIRTQAKLDIMIFLRIADALDITSRYVGSEPFSRVTSIYNEIMQSVLEKNHVEYRIIPRFEVNNEAISASKIRQTIKNGNLFDIQEWVPSTTYNFFESEEGREIIDLIQKQKNVIHY